MAANKKPRKRHIPKPHQIPVLIRFGADDERTLQLVPHQALERLINKESGESDWHTITCRLDIGLMLAKNHFTDTEQQVMVQALSAICDVSDRFKRVGLYGTSEIEAKSIGAGLVLTDEMQLNTTRRQMRDVIEFVMKEATV